MKLVVGLGNPGKEYENTRHNIGFKFLDKYLEQKKENINWTKKFDGLITECIFNNEKVIFLKPQTFMNLSGSSVKKVIDYYKININDILVVSDDLDLFVGNFKLKTSGSCGGHNGLRDIENKIKSCNYKKLKIGVSNDKSIDTKDYVLSKITKEEQHIFDNLFKELFGLLDDYFILSFEKLMNKYNRKNK